MSHWGICVAELESGAFLHELDADQWFLTASTAKLFATAAALDAYGADFRFETPVYRQGEVDANGRLEGDLILVASGDMTLGGRDTPDGEIAFTSIDHINAVVFHELATLTPENPLAGIDNLAQQVAASGITSVSGDVIIDDRLFPQIAKDDYVLSPVWINDNLIDITIKPGDVGQAATVDWRPQSSVLDVQVSVQTVGAGEALEVEVTSPAAGQLAVSGKIPVDVPQAIYTWQIEEPSSFARSVFIDSLVRHGVEVAANPGGDNPADDLPPTGSYTAGNQVAMHRSLPFSENIKLILKTSHNQHADMLIMLLALKQDAKDFDTGMRGIFTFLQESGLDPASISLSDGRGNDYTDLVSPRSVINLLRYMSTRPDFQSYYEALAIIGVDGTERDTVAPDSPLVGNAVAKSGMTVAGDIMNLRPLVMCRALAGYMTSQSGQDLVFAVYLNNLPIQNVGADVMNVIVEHGAVVEAIFETN